MFKVNSKGSEVVAELSVKAIGKTATNEAKEILKSLNISFNKIVNEKNEIFFIENGVAVAKIFHCGISSMKASLVKYQKPIL